MSDTKRSLGCFGFIAIIIMVGAITLIFFRVTDQVMRADEMARSAHPETVNGEFVSVDLQLFSAKQQKRKVMQIFLEGAAQPVLGPWVVKEVGDDVVVLAGDSGVLTVRIEVIVGVQVAPEEATKSTVPAASSNAIGVEPQLEK